MDQDLTRLVSVAGYGRSGSTLLGRLLGQMPGYFNIGELIALGGSLANPVALCGCGQHFRRCPFWVAVLDEAFGGMEGDGVKRHMRLHRDVMKRVGDLRRLPFAGSLKNDASATELVASTDALLRAIRHASGAHTIVDTSKFPPFVSLLERAPSVDLKVIHLIRDSRAVAYSWMRAKARTDVAVGDRRMLTQPPAQSAVSWNIANLWVKQICARNDHQFLRYCELTQDPIGTMSKLLAWLGEERPDLSFIGPRGAQLGVDHTIWGNPTRMDNGPVRITYDGEWREKMPAGPKALVTALTWPLLLAYGYFGPWAASPPSGTDRPAKDAPRPPSSRSRETRHVQRANAP